MTKRPLRIGHGDVERDDVDRRLEVGLRRLLRRDGRQADGDRKRRDGNCPRAPGPKNDAAINTSCFYAIGVTGRTSVPRAVVSGRFTAISGPAFGGISSPGRA